MAEDEVDDGFDTAELAEIRAIQERLGRALDELAKQEDLAPVSIIIEMMSIEARRGGIDSVILFAKSATGLVDDLLTGSDHPVRWALKRAQKRRGDKPQR